MLIKSPGTIFNPNVCLWHRLAILAAIGFSFLYLPAFSCSLNRGILPDIFRIAAIDTTIVSRDTVCSSELPVYWHQQTLINSGTYTHDTLIGSDSVRFRLLLLVLPTNLPKPGRPSSTSSVYCGGQSARLSTQSVSRRFIWEIIPSNAGTVQSPTDSASVSVLWESGFTGKVKILTKAKNSCGLSLPSDTLELWILSAAVSKLPRPVSADSAICTGTAFSDVLAPFPTQQYLWALSPVNAGGISGSGDSVRVNWNSAFTGMAYIFYNSVTPCGFRKSDSLAIRIKPRQASSILNLDTVYCIRNSQVVLDGLPAGGEFFVNNLPVTSFSIAQSGQFQIRYRPPGCFQESTRNVRVRPKTPAQILSPDTLVCASPLLHPLQGSPENGQFQVNGAFQTQFQAPLPGFYIINYHAFCTDTAKIRVRAASPPDVQISYAGSGFCLDTAPANIRLQPSGGQLFQNGNQVSAFIPSFNGYHTLIYKVTQSKCTASDTAVVKVQSRPSLFIAFDRPDFRKVCRRDTSVNVYGWPEQGFFSSPAIQNSVLNPRLLSPGRQFISYLGYNGVCLDSASLPLFVLDVPDVNAGSITDSLCEGGPFFNLTFASPSGGLWTGPAVSGSSFSPIRPGMNRLTYTLPADSLRCSNSDELEIFVKAKPQTYAPSDTLLCEGDLIRMGNPAGNFSFIWNDGGRDNVREIGSPGRWYFRVSDGKCSWNSDTLQISEIRPKPDFSLGLDRSYCFRDSLKLSGPGRMKKYRWEKEGEFLSAGPVFYVPEEGIYDLIVTDSSGCMASDRLVLVKADCPEVFVPEAFSPNGDGVNETLRIFGYGVKNLAFKIFNSWGEVIFEGQGKEDFWDGNFRGQPCPAGPYQYILQYAGSSEENNSFSGRMAGQVFLVR